MGRNRDLLQSFPLWGQRGWHHQEVAGESHYTAAIRKLFGDTYDPAGSELTVTAQLVPEPTNRHDPHAVSVRCGGAPVGYLPRADARRYVTVLSALVDRGWLPEVSARVWAGERPEHDYDRRGNLVETRVTVGSVRLDLGEPHLLVPANTPPDEPYALLPSGRAVQVTGEENHMPALTPLLNPEGECWIYVTLHELVEQRARSSRTVVEVRVDGAAVGTLTQKMSGELLPGVRHLAAQGAQTAARAILKGNRVKADVALYAARANELPQDWLDRPPITAGRRASTDGRTPAAHLESTPAAAEPQPSAGDTYDHWRFNPPPGWPPPPDGWVPPRGWRPDPAWPPAPPGWQFWLPRR